MSVPHALVTLRDQWLRGRRVDRRLRGTSLALLLVTLVVVGDIVLSPGAPAPGGQRVLQRWAAVWQMSGVQPTFLTFGTVEWLSNVVMFLPIGFFAAAAVLPPHRSWVLPLSAAGSVVVETMQLAIPGRVSSVTDVVANTVGTVLGIVLLVGWTDRCARRRPTTRR